jgi:ABC-type antimicrobial peptide transport system permease subunit
MPAFYILKPSGAIVVRVAGGPVRWVEPVRTVLGAMDPNAGLDVRPMSDAVAGAIFPMRVASGFLGALSGLGLLLALIGLYASVSYATSRRTREMGIRLALGATRARVLWTASRDGLALLVCGTLAGLGVAIALIRTLVDLLPDGVQPFDPVMLAVPVLFLLVTGLVAAWIPGRRASRTDPAAALRQD